MESESLSDSESGEDSEDSFKTDDHISEENDDSENEQEEPQKAVTAFDRPLKPKLKKGLGDDKNLEEIDANLEKPHKLNKADSVSLVVEDIDEQHSNTETVIEAVQQS